MAVMHTYLEVGSVISRARSLFAHAPATPDAAVTSAATLQRSADTVASTTTQMSQHSGQGADGHRAFAETSAPHLIRAAQSDTTLAAHLHTAAQITQTGSARLDAVAAQHQAIGTFAAAARTPAAQRAVLATLLSQAQQAQTVMSSTKQQAAGVAAQIQSVQYPTTTPPVGPDDTIVGPPRNPVQAVDVKQGPPIPPPHPPAPPGLPSIFDIPKPGGPPPLPNPLRDFITDKISTPSPCYAAPKAPPPGPGVWEKITTPGPGQTTEDLQNAWALYIGSVATTAATLPTLPGWLSLLAVKPSFDQLMKAYGIP